MASPKRGNYAAGRARRDAILDAAMARFAEQGYAATSLAEIARDVGITTPGVTHHFPTKLHLLIAIIERRFRLADEFARGAPPDSDGLGALRIMLGLAERFAGQPGLTELWVVVIAEAAVAGSDARALYEERQEYVIDELERAFRAGVETGRLRDDLDYRGIARECIAVSDGVQLQWVITGGRVDTVAVIRAHLERLAPTILAPGNDARL